MHFDGIIACEDPVPRGDEIGRSRAGRAITAHTIGEGPLRVSLVAGCHADEPVGPRFLQRLVRYLGGENGAALRCAATWSVVPHANPDGAEANAAWQVPGAARYDFAAYLRHKVRELPGDDIEFGFPRSEDDRGARPENRAVREFWRDAAPYDLHVSLHGMSVAAGPYFLVERSWWPCFQGVARTLARTVEEAGYALHDVERRGEKGFHRLERGFCSRPDSRAMRRHFLDLDDPATASRFRPSSMEAVRSLSGDTLTLVTEMPLFVTPGVGDELGPPDPALAKWRERIARWDAQIRTADDKAAAAGESPDVRSARVAAAQAAVRASAKKAGLFAMPVDDQMRFQWAFIRAGLTAVGAARGRAPRTEARPRPWADKHRSPTSKAPVGSRPDLGPCRGHDPREPPHGPAASPSLSSQQSPGASRGARVTRLRD